MIEELERREKQVAELIKNLPEIINKALKQVAPDIIKMNVGQHLKGKSAKGSKIGTYADSTKKQRRRKGLQVSFVDLEDTKNYHHGFAIAYLKDRIELESPETIYSIFLNNRYKDLFGLTKENENKLSKLIDPIIHAEMNRVLS